jgi:hypothetical protein
VTERERLRQEVVEALHHLVAYYLNRNAYAAGIANATKSLQIDPLREETYQQLMLLLSKSGQRSAALTYYDTCRRILDEELGIEPNAETSTIAEQIRNGVSQSRTSVATLPSYHLPTQATPFVGRTTELNQINEILDTSDCRLLSLTGPGGIGKTRLALQVATAQIERFTHGVYFVPLASVSVPDDLITTIADVVQVALDGSENPETQLGDYLHDKEMLLLLDNFEHLLEGATLVGNYLTIPCGSKY